MAGLKNGLNSDWCKRDTIIFGSVKEQRDFAPFESLTLAQLEALWDGRFIDPNERQNGAPSAQELKDFMVKWPGVLAKGYAVGVSRPDYRVTLTGLWYHQGVVSEEMRKEFVDKFGEATEFTNEPTELDCWWD